MVCETSPLSVTFLANASSVLKLDTLLQLSESTSYDLRAAYVTRHIVIPDLI